MRALVCSAAVLAAFVALSVAVGQYSATPDEGGADVELLLPAVPSLRPARSVAKQMLADDALAGRRSVAEAAALFRALDALPPAPVYPGGEGTDDAGYRLRVASFARTLAEEVGTAESRAAAERVRAEALAEGTAALPDPAGLTPVDEVLKAVEGYAERARAAAAARPPATPVQSAENIRGRFRGDRPARARRDRGESAGGTVPSGPRPAAP